MENRLKQIRAAEKESHLETYAAQELFQPGSWLAKPVKTVLDLLPLFREYERLNVLDLGSGVGRNSIPIAQMYGNIPLQIDCVDILDFAIEKLMENCHKYDVESCVEGIVMPLEEYLIKADYYDFVMAISALEHIDCELSFKNKLEEIREGIRKGGIVCLVINTQAEEKNSVTGEVMPPRFEVNLSTDGMKELLTKTFHGWEVLKSTVRVQSYDVPRGDVIATLTTNVVTFA